MSPGVVPFLLSQLLNLALFTFNDHNKFGGKGNQTFGKKRNSKYFVQLFGVVLVLMFQNRLFSS